MEQIILKTKQEYDYVVNKGFQPLLPNRYFVMTHRLRLEIIERLFGRRGKDVRAADARFFRWIWANKPHLCEECSCPLPHYSATFCSHILTRGAHPELAIDPRNVNILCFRHHQQWENGDRKSMRIYEGNQRIIEELKQEYNIQEKWVHS